MPIGFADDLMLLPLLTGFDHKDGSLYLRMVGSCSGCAQSHATLQEGVKKLCLGVGNVESSCFWCLVWVETEFERNVSFILFFGKDGSPWIWVMTFLGLAIVSPCRLLAAFRIAFRMDHYLPEVKQIVGLNDELDQQGFGIRLFRWLGWVEFQFIDVIRQTFTDLAQFISIWLIEQKPRWVVSHEYESEYMLSKAFSFGMHLHHAWELGTKT